MADRAAAPACGLTFGDRPLCTVIRPRFLTPAEYDTLRTAAASLLGAFRHAGGDGAGRRRLPRPVPARRLGGDAARRPRPRLHVAVAALAPRRLHRSGRRHRPDHRVQRRDAGRHRLHRCAGRALPRAAGDAPLPRALGGAPAAGVGASCTTSCSRAGIASAACAPCPSIAIVDWDDVPTQSEFRICRDYFRAMGIPCRITTPEALRYEGGKLARRGWHGHRPDLQARPAARADRRGRPRASDGARRGATARSAW